MDFLKQHFHALLYGGFWLSMISYGLVAPPDRVAMLDSSVVTKGWHLSAMGLCLGGLVLLLYWRRMVSGRSGSATSTPIGRTEPPDVD